MNFRRRRRPTTARRPSGPGEWLLEAAAGILRALGGGKARRPAPGWQRFASRTIRSVPGLARRTARSLRRR